EDLLGAKPLGPLVLRLEGLVAVLLLLDGDAGHAEARLEAPDLAFVLRRIDADKNIALPDDVPLLHRDSDDLAPDVGGDVDLGARLDLAVGRDDGGDLSGLDLRDVDLGPLPALRQEYGGRSDAGENDDASDDEQSLLHGRTPAAPT